MSIFFTSDTHFGHANIIKYCARPFADVQEMDRELVRRWNSVVGPRDTIYHLGDFSFGGNARRAEILAKLNGHKILVRGNHDPSAAKMLAAGFQEVHEGPHKFGEITLCHFPWDEFSDARGGTDDDGGWLFCGHVHTLWKKMPRCINVGVDQWDWTPVAYETLIRWMA